MSMGYVYAGYAGRRGGDEIERTDPTIGKRPDCSSGATCLTGDAAYQWYAVNSRDQQWAYMNNTAYNIANFWGKVAFDLAAGVDSSARSNGSYFSYENWLSQQNFMTINPWDGGVWATGYNIDQQMTKVMSGMASVVPVGYGVGALGWLGRSTTITKTLASRLADKAQKLMASVRPNTVAVIRHKDGAITIGRNQGGTQNSTVQSALSRAPSNCYAGQCAEINAISRALNKGRSLDGAEISISNVRGSGSTSGIHGTAKAPCTTCANVLNQFGL